jgi:hypothetical protein
MSDPGRKLSQKPDGQWVITGNASRIAEWKLVYTCLTPILVWLYGDEADDRNELARLVFEKRKELHQTFRPEDMW